MQFIKGVYVPILGYINFRFTYLHVYLHSHLKVTGLEPADLVFGFVDVKHVDDNLEVAQYLIVSSHVRRHDAAYDVFAQPAELFQSQVVERVRLAVVQQVESVRAVMVFQRSHVVVAVCQRRASTNLSR